MSWEYYYSEALKMKYAFNPETKDVMTEDKVRYKKEEYQLINEITPEIHALKKVFGGIIVDSNNHTL